MRFLLSSSRRNLSELSFTIAIWISILPGFLHFFLSFSYLFLLFFLSLKILYTYYMKDIMLDPGNKKMSASNDPIISVVAHYNNYNRIEERQIMSNMSFLIEKKTLLRHAGSYNRCSEAWYLIAIFLIPFVWVLWGPITPNWLGNLIKINWSLGLNEKSIAIMLPQFYFVIFKQPNPPHSLSHITPGFPCIQFPTQRPLSFSFILLIFDAQQARGEEDRKQKILSSCQPVPAITWSMSPTSPSMTMPIYQVPKGKGNPQYKMVFPLNDKTLCFVQFTWEHK